MRGRGGERGSNYTATSLPVHYLQREREEGREREGGRINKWGERGRKVRDKCRGRGE